MCFRDIPDPQGLSLHTSLASWNFMTGACPLLKWKYLSSMEEQREKCGEDEEQQAWLTTRRRHWKVTVEQSAGSTGAADWFLLVDVEPILILMMTFQLLFPERRQRMYTPSGFDIMGSIIIWHWETVGPKTLSSYLSTFTLVICPFYRFHQNSVLPSFF